MRQQYPQSLTQLYRWFPLRWTLATLIGFLLSLGWVEVGEHPDLQGLDGMLGGAMIGLTQGLMMGSWIPHAWLWIMTNSISWGLLGGSKIGIIGWMAPRSDVYSVRLLYGMIFGAIGGLWLGFWQWITLRNRIEQAGWCLITTPLSWSLGLSLGWLTGGWLRTMTHLFFSEVIGLMVTWIVVGFTSGWVFKSLLCDRLVKSPSSAFSLPWMKN